MEADNWGAPGLDHAPFKGTGFLTASRLISASVSHGRPCMLVNRGSSPKSTKKDGSHDGRVHVSQRGGPLQNQKGWPIVYPNQMLIPLQASLSKAWRP